MDSSLNFQAASDEALTQTCNVMYHGTVVCCFDFTCIVFWFSYIDDEVLIYSLRLLDLYFAFPFLFPIISFILDLVLLLLLFFFFFLCLLYAIYSLDSSLVLACGPLVACIVAYGLRG